MAEHRIEECDFRWKKARQSVREFVRQKCGLNDNRTARYCRVSRASDVSIRHLGIMATTADLKGKTELVVRTYRFMTTNLDGVCVFAVVFLLLADPPLCVTEFTSLCRY
ncbi:hypothetical protein J6590_049601 [Homalodisca vitripennis]|nr:hypothetical protein J6590_049601 [Homalodisca vitripennis]